MSSTRPSRPLAPRTTTRLRTTGCKDTSEAEVDAFVAALRASAAAA